MSIFPPHNIETMNEDDVAGELIRPFCRALGYSQGNPDANLRSQVSLLYDKAFLGHKDSKKDPVLRGRPDFVCEVVPYTRWVIEAKKPSVVLSLEDSYQAHTYSTHPEIAAEFYLLSNGRDFRLYRIANPGTPLMEWRKEETDSLIPALENILGPDAMRKRAKVKIDLGKPLGKGVGSTATIIGGHVVYTESVATFGDTSKINGLVNTVTGNHITRRENGLIFGEVNLKSAFAPMDEIFTTFGVYPVRFETAEEYISSDVSRPTLFQGLINMDIPAGTPLPKTPMIPGGSLPVRLKANAYVELVGFIDADCLRGTLKMNCQYDIPEAKILGLPADLQLLTTGMFEITIC